MNAECRMATQSTLGSNPGGFICRSEPEIQAGAAEGTDLPDKAEVRACYPSRLRGTSLIGMHRFGRGEAVEPSRGGVAVAGNTEAVLLVSHLAKTHFLIFARRPVTLLPRRDSISMGFTIARNLHAKQWRRAARHEELDEAMPDPAASPDEAAAQRDDFQRTLAAVQSLSEIDRAVLLLRAEEWLSYEDIATMTGLSVACAKVKVFRARAKLAVLLKPETAENQ